MHWFEQLTGLSPDGGNGALEALYDVVAAFAVASAAVVASRRTKTGRRLSARIRRGR
jgi:hypothetical protein